MMLPQDSLRPVLLAASRRSSRDRLAAVRDEVQTLRDLIATIEMIYEREVSRDGERHAEGCPDRATGR